MRKTMNYRQFAWIVGLMLVVFLAAYWIIGGQLHARREKENALAGSLIRLEDQNKEMEAELRLADSEDYIVNSAMTNYAFMNKNDLRFEITNPEALDAYTEEETKILLDQTKGT